MGDDLISRNELIANLMEQIPSTENVSIFKNIIESQKTAYNLDSVIEQLEELLQKEIMLICKHVSDASYMSSIIDYTMLVDAIEIVKSGGTNLKKAESNQN